METLYERLVNEGVEKGLEQGLERGLEQGLERGLQQGVIRGRTEERVAILTRQLERRFGPLPPVTSARIAAADPGSLERWLDRVLTEDSLDGVFRD